MRTSRSPANLLRKSKFAGETSALRSAIAIFMNIRFAKKDDLSELVEIYNQAIVAGEKTAHTSPFTTEQRLTWFEQYCNDARPMLVAANGLSIIGYLTLSPYRAGRQALSTTSEISYYVRFEYHKQGVATNLVARAIDLCPSRGIKHLLAILISSNQGSIKLLEKFGFEQWGCLPNIVEFGGNKLNHLYYGKSIE